MTPENRIEKVKYKILPVLRKYNVRHASLFGSVLQEHFKDESDIDILVDLPEELSLFDFIRLKNALEDSLERKVDLVEPQMIKEALRQEILSSQVPIL